MSQAPAAVTIVGGSLAGLTLALACASRGTPVRVLERSPSRAHGGDSLNVDLRAIARATGADPTQGRTLPVVFAFRDRHLATWAALHGWLRDRVLETPAIRLQEGRSVASLSDTGDAVLLDLADGEQLSAEAVIGADGYHSLVRRSINPTAPLARYAGYLVWRGLIEERRLSQPVRWPTDGGLWIEIVNGYRLVAAVLPGRDGARAVGQRQVTFAWFDAHQDALLRETGCLTPEGFIVRTLARGAVPDAIRAALARQAPALWPSVWAEAVAVGCADQDVVSGAPIAEYRPERLTLGRLAMVGDAGHVMAPMTGSGYASSVEDATMLSAMLAQRRRDEPLADVLARFGSARLPYIRGLVAHSQRLSAGYRETAHQRES